mgnify:CR=1 FL=1
MTLRYIGEVKYTGLDDQLDVNSKGGEGARQDSGTGAGDELG